MTPFWIYFCSSFVSLLGSNFLLFSQGWYLLQISGSKASVGLTWSLFFLPSLLVLPFLGQIFDSPRLKAMLERLERAKIFLFVLFFGLLSFSPRPELVLLLSVLYGICFVPYHPSVYVMVKRLVPPESQARYSYFFEISLQLANIIAVLASGWLFDKFGFLTLLLLSAGFVVLGLLGLRRVDETALTLPAASAVKHTENPYRRLWTLFWKNAGPGGELERRQFWFGVFHQIPQGVILVGNVPMILYVSDVMKKGAWEFGLLDGVFGLAALLISVFWSARKNWIPNVRDNALMSLLGGVTIASVALIPGTGLWPYLWMTFYGALLVSNKLFARAAIVAWVPKEKMGTFSTLFQMTGTMMMMGLFLVESAILQSHGVIAGYAFLAMVLIVYSGCLFLLNTAPNRSRTAAMVG